MTPDPYSGRVEDPMSQRPYMWNNNNPISYSDPTGYCLPFCALGGAAVVAGVEIGAGDVIVVLGGGAVGTAISANGQGILNGIGNVSQSIGSSLQGLMKKGGSESGAGERENGTDPKDDKKASGKEVEKIAEHFGTTVEDLKKDGGKGAGDSDIFRDSKGDYHVKPKDGKGPGEPLHVNRRDLGL
jgi:hypothetical protein